MDLRVQSSNNDENGLYSKCCVCNMTVYEILPGNSINICILCTAIRRCKRCLIPIIHMYNHNHCEDCWEKTFVVSCIIPNELYLSDFHTSKNYPLLRKHGIKQILTIGKELPIHYTNDFDKFYISLDDSPNEKISEHFSSVHNFISKAPTLVHCYAGISRSATLVISYLMRHKDMCLIDAVNYCRKIRPIVNPNYGFIKQLVDYEESLKNNNMQD